MTPLQNGTLAALQFPLLTAEQVGELLGGIPPKTILQFAREGRLPSIEIGRRVMFNRPCVEAAVLRAAERGERL